MGLFEQDLIQQCQGVWVCPKRMHSQGINMEGKSVGQLHDRGSPEEIAVKQCLCVCVRACARARTCDAVLSCVL